MTEYMCLIIIILMQVLCSSAQDNYLSETDFGQLNGSSCGASFPVKLDASSSVTFNKDRLTWNNAVNYCTRDGGKLLPFRSVIDIHEDPDKLGLTNEFDVWTADYLQSGLISFCGFKYLTSENFLDQGVFYGDCNATRSYFCMTNKGALVVYNGTRDRVVCTNPVPDQYLEKNKAFIKSGFYWTARRKLGTEVEGTGISDAILCGAYRRSIGKYYVNCNSYHNFLCEPAGQTGEKITEQNTIAPKSEQHATVSTSVPMISVSMEVENRLYENKVYAKEGSDMWIKVDIPVGIVLPVTCWLSIVIYIYRKRSLNKEASRTNIPKMTSISEQNNYETLDHKLHQEHQYESSKQLQKDYVGTNTYMNDADFRESD